MSNGAVDSETLEVITGADARPPNNPFGSLSPDAYASLGAMEGLYTPIVETAAQVAEAAKRIERDWPGYLVSGFAAGVAFLIHQYAFTRISAAIFAILVGVAIRNLLPLPTSITGGCKRIVKKVIPLSIVLIGAGLNLFHIAGVGLPALGITMICIALAIGAAYYVGRMFGLGDKTALLIGAGTGICGNSAIVAVAPLVDADDKDLVLSIGTVNLFGLLAMLAWPVIGGLLHLSDDKFGVWSGTTIHAVPQVVAAGQAYSDDAGALATLVKLVRVSLLAPLIVVLALYHARRHPTVSDGRSSMTIHYARLVPMFVWGFLAMALLSTLGLLPTLDFQPAGFLSTGFQTVELPLADLSTRAGKLLLTLAMAAIGLEVDIRLLGGVGARAVTTGLVVTTILAVASLAMVTMLV